MGRDVGLILITNDDGLSKGLLLLIEAASELDDEVVTIIPASQQSAVAKKITYHKALKVNDIEFLGHKITLISGTPADAIAFAINFKGFLKKKPDIVVSGINSGYNVSIHSILSSGTVGAAIEAATYGFPAIAFSAYSKADHWYSDAAWPHPEAIKKWTKHFISTVKKNGLPKGCDVLNVNYPLNPKTAKAVVCAPQLQHFNIKISEQKHKYALTDYWITGSQLAKAKRGQDVVEMMKGNVVVTPLSVTICEKGALNAMEKRYQGVSLNKMGKNGN